jgi:hypothetical protein
MTTTTTPQFLGSYTVQTSTPTRRGRSITGEFIIIGKRGATYRTYRTEGSTRVQFIAESGRFCALLGNYTMAIEHIAKCAVTLTDADRI